MEIAFSERDFFVRFDFEEPEQRRKVAIAAGLLVAGVKEAIVSGEMLHGTLAADVSHAQARDMFLLALDNADHTPRYRL